jgi:hypothetical protein
MKQLMIGTAVAGSAAFALRRLARAARKMHDHCRDMTASRQDAKPTASSGCVS